jgi:hypothetical protein
MIREPNVNLTDYKPRLSVTTQISLRYQCLLAAAAGVYRRPRSKLPSCLMLLGYLLRTGRRFGGFSGQCSKIATVAKLGAYVGGEEAGRRWRRRLLTWDALRVSGPAGDLLFLRRQNRRVC